MWRSDIIILLYDSPPSYIPTHDDFYDRAKSLKDQLSAARKEGLDSKEYEDALACVLATLYDLVGRPVTQRLVVECTRTISHLVVPDIRVCSLPIHAMDLYDRKAL